MIPKGCTCENSFLFPFKREEVENLCIAYKEDDVIKLQKNLEDCTFKDGKIYVSLSQGDTLKFTDNAFIKVQIRVRLKDGATTKSNVMETYTDDVVFDGVI